MQANGIKHRDPVAHPHDDAPLMCRIAAWTGAPCALEDVIVRPKHSLLRQSQHAQEAKLAVNGDGFGVAWYDGIQTQPGLYRDVLPAWSDGNLPALCRMIRAPLFLAHVRASTIGETSRANCHPFTHGRWSFCHNGQIPSFAGRRRALEAALPDDLYAARRGTTDSEVLFLTLLMNGLDTDPARAVRRSLETLAPEPGEAPNRVTLLFSDGVRLFALRHASDHKAPTLYMRSVQQTDHVIASEPLDETQPDWRALRRDTLYCVQGKTITQEPLAEPVQDTAL